MFFYAFTVFSIALFGLSSAREILSLPVITCKRDTFDYSACLKHALEEAWPRFVKGLPEFDFPSLNPLFYEYGKVVFNSGEIHAEVIMSNTTASGLPKSYFNDVRPDFIDDIFRLEIDSITPKIFVKGYVKMNGTLGIFRIAREGPFNVTADDVRATWDITGHVINDTWILEHIILLPSVKKLKINFDLFQDNKEFNDIIVSFANEYWPPLYRMMLPVASREWDRWLVNIGNKLFSKVSFSEVFP